MCGILGVYSKNSANAAPVTHEKLARGLQQLHHRGPDAQKTWIGYNGRVGLGHTRLSIIDLSTGDQPLTDETETIHAVVNGELYGFEEIRYDLEKLGHRFKTKSDSEVLIHLYKEYGTACLQQMRGEFAFILWDQSNQLLFSGRDRFGIKPLYYHANENEIAFASEIKALFPLGIDASWDSESLYQLHTSFSLLQSRTLYKGIYQVPPGHYLIATQNQTQVLKYWDFDYPSAQELKSESWSEAEAIERVKMLLHDSVKTRLRADVPVACYLSGGLDSCSILGIASTYLDQPMHAFTLSFDQEEYDEGVIAKEMAAHAGAKFTAIPVQAKELADNFEEALWHSEVPLFNTHGVAKFMLSKAVRDAGYKVVLTGEGSDEIFAGYPHFRKDFILHNSENQDPTQVSVLLEQLKNANLVSQGLLMTNDQVEEIKILKSNLGRVPSYLESHAHLCQKLSSFLHTDWTEPLAKRDSFRMLLDSLDARQLKHRDAVNQAMYLWSKSLLPNYILSVLGDRMEMGHSIEGRVPFLDHKLIEFVTKLPIHLKIKGPTEKFILREAAKDVLTDTVYRRQKHPFLAPPTLTRKDSALFEMIQDTLRGSQLRNLPFYDQAKIVELLDRLPTMSTAEQTEVDPILTVLLSVCALQKKLSVH